MTEQPLTEEGLDGDERSKPSLAWEVPEIAATAILASVAVLIVGGLATGIARAVTETGPDFPPGLSSQEVWNAMQFGSEWAGPLLAVVMLGVLGLCWWQAEAWAEATETPSDRDDESEARGHIHRARLLARWAVAALVVTAVGSIAGFVAAVGANAEGAIWTVDIYVGASVLAVVVLLGAGVWVNRRVQRPDVPTSVSVEQSF